MVAGSRTPQENASAILRYFRSCGWITPKEVGRSGDNIASVAAYCRKLIDALHKIFDTDANSAITNHIFSMYEILKSSFAKENGRTIRPYSNILVPLVEHECDLKNEILILKDSIREIMRSVIKMADVNSFGHFLMKDELLNRFFQDYFFIKKSGLIPSYIASIDRLLQKLRKSDIYGQMIREYTSLKRVEEQQAKMCIRDRNGIDLTVENGEFVAVVGTSGSGKSTLLHLLGGLDRPTSGKVFVDGKDIFSLKEEALTIFRRRKIGFVFQAYNLVPVLNVFENIALPVELDGKKVDPEFAGEIIQTLGLEEKQTSFPNQLSGGQQQRVAIARALASKPAILLCDEPTGNLDSRTSQDVLGLLKISSRKYTPVSYTHLIGERVYSCI